MSCGHMDTQVRLESGWNEIGEKMIGEEDDYGNGMLVMLGRGRLVLSVTAKWRRRKRSIHHEYEGIDG